MTILEKPAKIVSARGLRSANPQEVLKKTGCKTGLVHPFGNLHNPPTYVDASIFENYRVNFNARLHTVSIQMRDLIRASDPIIESLSKV